MKTKTTPPEFIYVTYINTTPRKLWQALTATALIRRYWMGRENTSTWKRGAALESRDPAGELEWHGRIIESQPPRRLVYSFRIEGADQPESRVTMEIASLKNDPEHRGRGVRLTVTHAGYAPGSRQLKGISRGWPAILSSLKSLLETGASLGLAHVD
jgi:uncharacterized protein YndB with AHSA1/START domain